MYHDDSSAEIKLTDVTHCDLETKSILKPPKVRAPLQEVDLGNQISVEFDVIRKRRVSFAGVNKIKEFNSEAKSFCIYNTPVYEEKVSTSSDSSALSTSVSGNLINLSKENDATLLNDTMDLTDLSIVQPSCAMDITFMKPQNLLPDVQDIFASKSQVAFGDKVSSNQFDEPVLQSESNEGIAKSGSGSDPLGIFSSHALVKPTNKGPIFDPAKALLNEMLEDSVVDSSPMDQYLKANSLFIQNKFPLPSVSTRHGFGENNYRSTDCKKTFPEMECSEAVPVPVNKVTFPVEVNAQQKTVDSFQHHLNIRQNQPHLFDAYNINDMDESRLAKRMQGEFSQMGFSEAVPSSKIQPLDSQGIQIQNRSMKALNGSQMEFTEVLPFKNSQTVPNTVSQNLNPNNRLLANTSNVSQMEFTEAVPLRNYQVVTNKLEQENLFVNKNQFTSNIKNENISFLSSHMEFTEVLPMQKLVREECTVNPKDKVDEIERNGMQSLDNSYSMDTNIKPLEPNIISEGCLQNTYFASTKQNDHLNESNSMDVTELNNTPTKYDSNSKQNNEIGNNIAMPFLTPNFGFTNEGNISQMEFTEAIPTRKHCVGQGSSKFEGTLQGISSNVVPKNDDLESKKCSPSEQLNESNSMDVTELNNTPTKPQNVKYESNSNQNNEIGNSLAMPFLTPNFGLSNEGNISQMEFTEAIPTRKHCVGQGSSKFEGILQGISSNVVPKNDDLESKKCSPSEQLNESNSMDVTELNNTPTKPQNVKYEINSNQNNEIENNIEMPFLKPNFGLTNEGNISQMEFTEAFSSKNNIIKTNQENLDNYNVFMTKSKSLASTGNNIFATSSCMEFTEVVTLQKQQSTCKKDAFICDNVKRGNIENENIPHLQKQSLKDSNAMNITERDRNTNEIICSNQMKNHSVAIFNDNNIQLEQINLRFSKEHQTSQMEFTEALPLKNTQNVINDGGKQGYFETVNSCGRKSILPPKSNNTFETSNMEFTEALPMCKLKQANTCPQVTLPLLHKNISPSDGILTNENIPSLPKDKLDDSCSMDVTGINNVVYHNYLKGNVENKIPTTGTNIVETDKQQRPSKGQEINSQNISPLFGSCKMVGEIQDNNSQMEFTEAIPCKNVQIIKPKIRKSIMVSNYTLGTSQMEFTEAIPTQNADIKQFVSDYKEVESEATTNYKSSLKEENLNDSCSMDVTTIGNESLSKEKEQLIRNDGGNADSYLRGHRPDVQSELHQKPQIVCTETVAEEMPQKKLQTTSFRSSSPELCKTTIKGVLKQEIFPLSYNPKLEKSSNDSTQMDFTEDVRPAQFQMGNLKQNEIVQVPGENRTDIIFNFMSSDEKPEKKEIRFTETSQMEFTEVIPRQKPHLQPETVIKPSLTELDPKVVKDDLKNENIPPIHDPKLDAINSVDDTKMDFTETVLSPIVKESENINFHKTNKSNVLTGIPSGQSNNQFEGFCETNAVPSFKSAIQNHINEDNLTQRGIASINTQKLDNFCLANDYSFELTEGVVPLDITKENDTSKLNQNAIGHDKPQPHPKILDSKDQTKKEFENLLAESFSEITITDPKIDNINETHNIATKYEPVSSTQNLNSTNLCSTNVDKLPSTADDKVNCKLDKHCSKLDTIDSINVINIQSKNNVISSQQPLNIPVVNYTGSLIEGKRISLSGKASSDSKPVLKTISKEIIEPNMEVDEEIDARNVSHKKSLVHFNTPPIRDFKKRRTMGPLSPNECRKLFQISSFDSNQCFNANDEQSRSQKRGIFEEEINLDYDPDKGKKEWERLIKNDSFMKAHSFEFVSPVKWKYKFEWPLEVVLEIPDIEVNENSKKKNITLFSKISQSDPVAMFVDARMKKNMNVILTEKWLNSHCKTIKDLLLTIKFIKEEYSKLEPFSNSLKYFYEEVPYDFIKDKIIFTIVNLRKEYCFEVRIDVSYGQVKGKNIDIINHVGRISKTKVQQLFDQLKPNKERFLLFWQKLKNVHEF